MSLRPPTPFGRDLARVHRVNPGGSRLPERTWRESRRANARDSFTCSPSGAVLSAVRRMRPKM
jgi:hypothetical protein